MKAYEVLEHYDWVQGETALDSNNVPVLSTDPSACKFCLNGAMLRAYGDDPNTLREHTKVLSRTVLSMSNRHYVLWNDTPGRTKEDVVNLLKELDI